MSWDREARISSESDAKALVAEHLRLQKDSAKTYYDNGMALYFLFWGRKFLEQAEGAAKYEWTMNDFERYLLDHGSHASREDIEKRMLVFKTFHDCSRDVIQIASEIGISKAVFASSYIEVAKQEGRDQNIQSIMSICLTVPFSGLAEAFEQGGFSSGRKKRERKSKDDLQIDREKRALSVLAKTDPRKAVMLNGEMFVPRRTPMRPRDEAKALAVFEVLREAHGLANVDETFEWMVDHIYHTFGDEARRNVDRRIREELAGPLPLAA